MSLRGDNVGPPSILGLEFTTTADNYNVLANHATGQGGNYGMPPAANNNAPPVTNNSNTNNYVPPTFGVPALPQALAAGSTEPLVGLSNTSSDHPSSLTRDNGVAPASASLNNDNNVMASSALNMQQQSSEPTQPADANPYGYTTEEMATIDRCEEECKDRFPAGRTVSEVFDNPKAACAAFNDTVGKQFGFKVSQVSSSLQCYNADPPTSAVNAAKKREKNVAPDSKRVRKSHRNGCKYRVGLSPYDNKNKADKRVILTTANYRHCHGCRPSSHQLMVHNVKSGTHTRTNAIASDRIQALINMQRFGEHVEAKSIRNTLKDALPENHPVSAGLIANVRARIEKAAESMEVSEGAKVNAAITTEDAHKIIKESMDDDAAGKLCGMALNDPTSMGLATKQLRDMLRKALLEGKELDQIVCLLYQIKESDNTFDFRYGKDANGNITCVVWQDGIMRGHCQEGLLDVVMLDMMKRQQNSADWPYCGPVLITGENKVACGAEAIVLTEDIDSYVYIMNGIYEMSGVHRSATKVIFGDGILSTNILRRLGIENSCKLILDRKHLMSFDWPGVFGPFVWARISPFMSNLVYAKTEEDYNNALHEVRTQLTSQNHQNYVENEIHPNRFHFVDYWIKSYEGQLNRVGDQGAEGNHSSYCARISFGGFVHPAKQLTQCLERSKDIGKELSTNRYELYMKDLNEANDLRKNCCIEDANALLSLSPEGLKLWNEAKELAPHYQMRPSSLVVGCNEIFRSEDQQSAPRILGPDKPCDCKKKVAYCSLCVHQYKQDNGKFILDRFPKRFHRRNAVFRPPRVNPTCNSAEGGKLCMLAAGAMNAVDGVAGAKLQEDGVAYSVSGKFPHYV